MIAVDPALAGTKVECPDCGDVNIVPLERAGAPPSQPEPARHTPPPPTLRERATYAAAPPSDSPADGDGVETRVLLVRPSLVRGRPVAATLLALGPLAMVITLAALGQTFVNRPWWVYWLAFPALGWVTLLLWWVRKSGVAALEVTTRRTSYIRGLVFRNRVDVFHRDAQSVTVYQTPLGHILNVGSITIASDLGAPTANDSQLPKLDRRLGEIEMLDVPRPRAVRDAIERFIPQSRRP